MLTGGRLRFVPVDTTTLHTINSCIVKLGKVTKACKVYRGVAGGVLPDEFWHEDQVGAASALEPPLLFLLTSSSPRLAPLPPQHLVRGGVEFSFMSTTKSFDVAMDYARAKGESSVSIVFEMIQGLVDRGADLKWLSQYPHEEEVGCGAVLFEPLSGKRWRVGG